MRTSTTLLLAGLALGLVAAPSAPAAEEKATATRKFEVRKDQELKGEKAVRRACEETARFLVRRKLQNVFVDLMHEYNHKRCDLDIFKEPDGAKKKARLTAWFKKQAPEIPAGVCPTYKS